MSNHLAAIAQLQTYLDEVESSLSKQQRILVDNEPRYHPAEAAEQRGRVERIAKQKADLSESIRVLESQMMVVEFNVEVQRFDHGRVVIDPDHWAEWQDSLGLDSEGRVKPDELQEYLEHFSIEPEITKGDGNEVVTWSDAERVTP